MMPGRTLALILVAVAFSATGQIDRRDFGLTWNKTLDKGGVAVGDEVTISVDGEANMLAPAKK